MTQNLNHSQAIQTSLVVILKVDKDLPRRSIYKQSFSKDWQGQLSWLSSSSQKELNFCMSYNKHLLCSKGGIRDLKQHRKTEVHKKCIRSGRQKCLL